MTLLAALHALPLRVKGSAGVSVPGRASRGLYHGKGILSGNLVSFSERKTRTVWRPNVVTKNVYSEQLNGYVRLSLTTKALRCIDKYGGLDEYLLRCRPHKLRSDKALELRDLLLSQRKAAERRARFVDDADAAARLPTTTAATAATAAETPTGAQQLSAIAAVAAR